MNQYSNEQPPFNLKKIIPIALLGVIFIVLIAFGSSMTVTIPEGHSGVIFRQFDGGLNPEEAPFGEGFHIIAPWNRMIVYEVRQQEISETMNVLSSNGLEIDVDVSIWFRPEKSKLGDLHSELGTEYSKKVVIPSLRSSTRSVIGRFTPEEIYSTERDAIQNDINEEAQKLLKEKYVQLDKILIRSIILPATIKGAIERKLKQEQESLEYEFKLEKAQKEAERQRIEAEGKAKANEIISRSLTDKILREKGIEATLKLSESENSKVIVVGSGKDGLPIILGNQ